MESPNQDTVTAESAENAETIMPEIPFFRVFRVFRGSFPFILDKNSEQIEPNSVQTSEPKRMVFLPS